MMRLAALIILATAALAPASWAQTSNSAKGRLDISGVSPSACLITAAPTTGGANAIFTQTAQSSAEVRIANLVNPQTGQAQAATINLALPVVCNTSHQLILRTANGGLSRSGDPAPAAGFRELVPYTVNASWAGLAASGGSQDTQPITLIAPNGAAGSLSVNISVPAGGLPLVAGDYNDNIVIELRTAN